MRALFPSGSSHAPESGHSPDRRQAPDALRLRWRPRADVGAGQLLYVHPPE